MNVAEAVTQGLLAATGASLRDASLNCCRVAKLFPLNMHRGTGRTPLGLFRAVPEYKLQSSLQFKATFFLKLYYIFVTPIYLLVYKINVIYIG